MSGDLKVAVAGFGELDGGGRVVQTATTRDLAAGMAEAIDRDLQPLARRNWHCCIGCDRVRAARLPA